MWTTIRRQEYAVLVPMVLNYLLVVTVQAAKKISLEYAVRMKCMHEFVFVLANSVNTLLSFGPPKLSNTQIPYILVEN